MVERAAGSIARTGAGRAGRTGTGRHPIMEEGAPGHIVGARHPIPQLMQGCGFKEEGCIFIWGKEGVCQALLRAALGHDCRARAGMAT